MTETTTTVQPEVSDLIKAVANGDTVTEGNTFTDIMAAKKQAALDIRKQEFAAQIFDVPVEVEEPATAEEPAVEEE